LYATPRFHMTATPRFHRPPPTEGVISLSPLFRGGIKGSGVVSSLTHYHPLFRGGIKGGGVVCPASVFTVHLRWRGLSAFTPSLEGVTHHHPLFRGGIKGVVLSAHPPVSHERHPPGFTVPLRWRGLSAFTPSLEGESKGVVSSAHPSVSHDRHPPVSHDCHPPVSPSPSGGGGYHPLPTL